MRISERYYVRLYTMTGRSTMHLITHNPNRAIALAFLMLLVLAFAELPVLLS